MNQSESDDISTLVRCARLFHEQKLTKSEIAKQLGVSAMQITRWMRRAEQQGIIQIHVKSHPICDQLEIGVTKKFGLKAVKVIEYAEDYDVLKQRIGEAAAVFFEEQVSLRENAKVGIGGGATIYEMIEKLQTKPRYITVYPMALFGRGPEVTYFDSTYLATFVFLKSRPSARAFSVGIPPLPSDANKAVHFAENLCEEIPEINAVLEGSRNVDIAFVSLGTHLEYDDVIKKLGKYGSLGKALKSNKICGGLNYNYFDKDGQEIDNFLLKVNINDLKDLSAQSTKRVVLLAAGKHKSHAIRITLESKMVNSIITDSVTAQYLLSE